MPDISIIIATRDSRELGPLLTQIDRDRKKAKLTSEIIIAEGNSPSRQRNAAAKIATGEYLLFLDDDSLLDDRYFHYLKDEILLSGSIDVLGGPAVVATSGTLWEDANRAFFSSSLAIGPFVSRYNSIGAPRLTTEKELILCNLCIKRKSFLDNGGFLEELYPHEENEFLRRISNTSKIAYHPLIRVSRPPRITILSFCQQMLGYGDGRSKYLSLSRSPFDRFFFLPAMMILFGILGLTGLSFGIATSQILFVYLIYFSIIIFESLMLTVKAERPRIFPILLLLFPSCHLAYGLGILIGFFRYFPPSFLHRHKPPKEIKVKVYRFLEPNLALQEALT